MQSCVLKFIDMPVTCSVAMNRIKDEGLLVAQTSRPDTRPEAAALPRLADVRAIYFRS